MGLAVGIFVCVFIAGAINGNAVSRNGARRETNHTGGIIAFGGVVAVIVALMAG